MDSPRLLVNAHQNRRIRVPEEPLVFSGRTTPEYSGRRAADRAAQPPQARVSPCMDGKRPDQRQGAEQPGTLCNG